MKKRLLAILLVAALACVGLAGTALAATVTEIVPCKYEGAYERYSDGLLAVKQNGKWGYIDKTGKVVVPFKYDATEQFTEGLAWVKLNGTWGVIDRTDQVVVPFGKYEGGACFFEGLAPVMQDGKYRYIDKTGREVLSFNSYEFAGVFREGLARIRSNGKWGFVDTTGKEVVPCKYDSAMDFSDGLAKVGLEGRYFKIDRIGKEVVQDDNGITEDLGQGVVKGDYIAAWDVDQGVVGVRYENRKIGFVDKTTGEELLSPQYDECSDAAEGMVVVAVYDGKGGYLSGVVSINSSNTAYPSTQKVNVDGKAIEFQCYALKDAAGNDTNYIKLRDLADILNGSAAQFEVGWDGNVTITTGKGYTKNGSEQNTPFSGQREYKEVTAQTLVDGKAVDLAAFTLTDDNGNGYTYFKLRDLGTALGFKVDWTAQRGIFIETK